MRYSSTVMEHPPGWWTLYKQTTTWVRESVNFYRSFFFQCKHFCRIFCFRIVLSSTKITFTTTNFFKAIVIFCQNTLWKLFVKGECLPFVNFGICIRFVGNWHMIVKILNHVCQTEKWERHVKWLRQ